MKQVFPILFIIILITSFLRLYRLGDLPVGLHRDEAFLGYNAYSLLETGRDMTGHILPLHFESFLYSPGGYSYAAIPAIALFGLSPFSVRLPSALFGIATVVLAFFFIQVFFRSYKYRNILAVTSAAILAITPWHINLSRTATENILVVFFITLGLILYRHYQYKNNLFLLGISFASFAITLTLYQAPRSFLPLFLPLFLLLESKGKLTLKKFSIPFSFLGLTIFLPIALILSDPHLATRINTVSIFATDQTKLVTLEQIREDGIMHVPPKLSHIMHNKLIGYVNAFTKNYFSHFNYDFLFSDQGLPERYRVPYTGLLYIIFLPLFLYGTFRLLSTDSHTSLLLFSWMGLALVGSALTFDDVPNLQRTVILFPALSIVIAYGITELSYRIQKKHIGKSILAVLAIFLCIELSRYLYHYSVQQVAHRPWARHEGYQKLVNNVNSRLSSYRKAVITNRESAPAIFFLFFSSYDPATYIQETKNSSLRDFDRVNFANYEFSQEECPFLENEEADIRTGKTSYTCYVEPNILYVNSGVCKLPKVCARVLDTINRSDGTRVFTILDMSPSAATRATIHQR